MGKIRKTFRAVTIVLYWAILTAFSFGQQPQFSSQNPPVMASAKWDDPTICFLDGATGSYISIDGDSSFILSCAHGLKGLNSFAEGTSRHGQPLRCQVVAIDPEGDAAILKFNGTASQPAKIADAPAPVGSQLWHVGFPMGGKLATKPMTARCGGTAGSPINEGVGAPIFGDSGGPVRNSAGELVGVISGTRAYNVTPNGQVYPTGIHEGFYAQHKTIVKLINEVRQRGYVHTQCGGGGCNGGQCFSYGSGCDNGQCGSYYPQQQSYSPRPSYPPPPPAIQQRQQVAPSQSVATPAITAEHYSSMKAAIEQLQRMTAAQKPCNCDPNQYAQLVADVKRLNDAIANVKGCNCDPRLITQLDLRLTALEAKCGEFKSCACTTPPVETPPAGAVPPNNDAEIQALKAEIEALKNRQPLPSTTAAPRTLEGVIKRVPK